MSVSIVISNYNRRDELARTLESVRALDPGPAECIVVDNHSTDGSRRMIAERFPEVRVIPLSRNYAVGAVNRGIQASRGDVVLALDNDMTLDEPGALARVEAAFRGNERLGAAAFRVDTPGGPSPNSPKFDPDAGGATQGFEAAVFDGGAVALRRSALDEAGLYPEDFFLYHNELALAGALWDADFEVRYFPDLVAVHHHSAAARNPDRASFLWWRNFLRAAWRYLPAGRALRETALFLLVHGRDAGRRGRTATWALAALVFVAGLPAELGHRHPWNECTARRMARIRWSAGRIGPAAGDAAPSARGRARDSFWKWYLKPNH